MVLQAEKSMRVSRRAQVVTALCIPALALVGVVLHAIRSGDPLQVLAAALTLSGAAALTGGLLGFLFGVPRSLVTSNGPSDGTALSSVRMPYRANTNLEQISDWLTKILIGVGLTQLVAISDTGRRLVNSVAPALGGGAENAAYAGALLVYFAIMGFLGGWLATRLYLGQALTTADRALEVLIAAEQEQRDGNDERAGELRELAAEILHQSADLPRRYELVRNTLPSGEPRTALMEEMVAAARRAGAVGKWTAPEVRTLLESDSEGDRVTGLGLIQGNPALLHGDRVLEVISTPHSRFEHYHALLAALEALDEFSPEERIRLSAAIAGQLTSGEVPVSSRRRALARRLLHELRVRSS